MSSERSGARDGITRVGRDEHHADVADIAINGLPNLKLGIRPWLPLDHNLQTPLERTLQNGEECGVNAARQGLECFASFRLAGLIELIYQSGQFHGL
jgi:hypothetical protein